MKFRSSAKLRPQLGSTACSRSAPFLSLARNKTNFRRKSMRFKLFCIQLFYTSGQRMACRIDWRWVQMHFRRPQFIVSCFLSERLSCWEKMKENGRNGLFQASALAVCVFGGVCKVFFAHVAFVRLLSGTGKRESWLPDRHHRWKWSRHYKWSQTHKWQDSRCF